MGKHEAALIELIRSRFPNFSPGLGIGDDAALLDFSGTLVITNDMLVEDVDFTAQIPLRFVAEKSLAVNLSDLAAMGAAPLAFVLALGIPRNLLSQMNTFIDALTVYAQKQQIELIGGDLSRSEKLVISITAIGRLLFKRALLRSGAREGERLFLSRPVGASAAGLDLLRAGWTIDPDGTVRAPKGIERSVGYAQREFATAAIQRHVAPEPEIVLGARLATLDTVTSCIDVSDGLSSDVRNLCAASAKGAVIDWERIPAFPDLVTVGRGLGIDVERAILHGGEDYALLFTSSARESELSSRLGRPVYAIGRITAENEILLERGGTKEPLADEGFDHFA